jgi:hypothetical protein
MQSHPTAAPERFSPNFAKIVHIAETGSGYEEAVIGNTRV